MADKQRIISYEDTSYYRGIPCTKCGKPMYKKDSDYALYKFGRVVCRDHCGDSLFSKHERPEAEIKAEQEFLKTNTLEDIPF